MIKIKFRYKLETEDYYLNVVHDFVKKTVIEKINTLSYGEKRSLLDFWTRNSLSKFVLCKPNLLVGMIEAVFMKYPFIEEYYCISSYYSSCLILSANTVPYHALNTRQHFDQTLLDLLERLQLLYRSKPSSVLLPTMIELAEEAVAFGDERKKARVNLNQIYSLMNGKGVDDYFPSWIFILKDIFNYEGCINKPLAMKLLSESEVHVCPYCNVHNIKSDNYQNKIKKSYRPALDHFYPKSKYPFLGLSLYNLVPACGECNTTNKGSYDTYENPYPNPFNNGLCHERIFEIANFEDLSIELKYNKKVNDLVIDMIFNENTMGSQDLFDLAGRYTDKGLDDTKSCAKQVFDSYVMSQRGINTQIGLEDLPLKSFVSIIAGIDFDQCALKVVHKKMKVDFINQVYSKKYKV
ncbi:HNH endonuclease [Vibrio splendidus]